MKKNLLIDKALRSELFSFLKKDFFENIQENKLKKINKNIFLINVLSILGIFLIFSAINRGESYTSMIVLLIFNALFLLLNYLKRDDIKKLFNIKDAEKEYMSDFFIRYISIVGIKEYESQFLKFRKSNMSNEFKKQLTRVFSEEEIKTMIKYNDYFQKQTK